MSQAIVDPKELRDFASSLKQFDESMDDLIKGLLGRFRNLEGTWRDQEKDKFAGELEQAVKSLRCFHDQSEEFLKYLDQKAKAIEAYFGHGY